VISAPPSPTNRNDRAPGEFSVLPAWLAGAAPQALRCTLRPFGVAVEDLEVDFHQARRPRLVTRLLALCAHALDGTDIGEEAVQRMPVGARIEALLVLASLTQEQAFSWRMRCGSGSCAAESEFELTLVQILALGDVHRDRETIVIMLGDIEATLRRPSGLDQSRWLEQSADLQLESMLRSVLVRPDLDEVLEGGTSFEQVASLIDDAMDEFDPLVGFHLSVVCPECGAATDVSPDLTAAALERLSRLQRAAIEDIHQIAACYHWTESEILQLPAWRRQSYLGLISAGAR
jgi:hypothetical protein